MSNDQLVHSIERFVSRIPMPVRAVAGVWAIIGMPFMMIPELQKNMSPVIVLMIGAPAIVFWLGFVAWAALSHIRRVAGLVRWLLPKRNAND